MHFVDGPHCSQGALVVEGMNINCTNQMGCFILNGDKLPECIWNSICLSRSKAFYHSVDLHC